MVTTLPSSPMWMWGVIALLAAFSATGDAIHCYNCNSLTDRNCGDPYLEDATHKTECSPDVVQRAVNEFAQTVTDTLSKFGMDIPAGTPQIEFVCQKVKFSDKKGNDVVIRTCAFNPDAVNTCFAEKEGTVCLQCSSDLCNAAPISASATAFALLLAPAIALRMLAP